MEAHEIILLPIYILLLLMAGFTFSELRYRNDESKKWFLPAFATKLLGAILYCCIYKFYYGEGDVFVYFRDAQAIWEMLMQHPADGWKLFFSEPRELDLAIYAPTHRLPFYESPTTFMVVRLAAVLNFFAFNSFWVTSLLMASLSFSGLWALYRVFIDLYPKLKTEMAIAVFFIPSVFFWGSGIMKDTVTIGALGWLTYGVYQLFFKRQKIILSCVLVVVCAYLINTIKGYILMGFMLPLVYWLVASVFRQIKDASLKIILMAAFLGSVAIGAFLLRDQMNAATQYVLEKYISMAIDFQTYHGTLASQHGQSGYSLGEISFTPVGVLSKMPAAINVTLFRPYLFEVSNPVMLVTALESSLFLFFTIYVLFKVGFLRLLSYLFQYPSIGFCLFFTFIFAFSVGFTSYNYGALVRYKIPCLPFYVGALFMLLECRRVEGEKVIVLNQT